MNKREFVLAGCGTLGAGVAGAMQPAGSAAGACADGWPLPGSYIRQLTACRASRATRAGTRWLQTGAALPQRGWKRHPDGGLMGLGGSPASAASSVRWSGSIEGIEDSSARV